MLKKDVTKSNGLFEYDPYVNDRLGRTGVKTVPHRAQVTTADFDTTRVDRRPFKPFLLAWRHFLINCVRVQIENSEF